MRKSRVRTLKEDTFMKEVDYSGLGLSYEEQKMREADDLSKWFIEKITQNPDFFHNILKKYDDNNKPVYESIFALDINSPRYEGKELPFDDYEKSEALEAVDYFKALFGTSRCDDKRFLLRFYVEKDGVKRNIYELYEKNLPSYASVITSEAVVLYILHALTQPDHKLTFVNSDGTEIALNTLKRTKEEIKICQTKVENQASRYRSVAYHFTNYKLKANDEAIAEKYKKLDSETCTNLDNLDKAYDDYNEDFKEFGRDQIKMYNSNIFSSMMLYGLPEYKDGISVWDYQQVLSDRFNAAGGYSPRHSKQSLCKMIILHVANNPELEIRYEPDLLDYTKEPIVQKGDPKEFGIYISGKYGIETGLGREHKRLLEEALRANKAMDDILTKINNDDNSTIHDLDINEDIVFKNPYHVGKENVPYPDGKYVTIENITAAAAKFDEVFGAAYNEDKELFSKLIAFEKVAEQGSNIEEIYEKALNNKYFKSSVDIEKNALLFKKTLVMYLMCAKINFRYKNELYEKDLKTPPDSVRKMAMRAMSTNKAYLNGDITTSKVYKASVNSKERYNKRLVMEDLTENDFIDASKNFENIFKSYSKKFKIKLDDLLERMEFKADSDHKYENVFSYVDSVHMADELTPEQRINYAKAYIIHALGDPRERIRVKVDLIDKKTQKPVEGVPEEFKYVYSKIIDIPTAYLPKEVEVRQDNNVEVDKEKLFNDPDIQLKNQRAQEKVDEEIYKQEDFNDTREALELINAVKDDTAMLVSFNQGDKAGKHMTLEELMNLSEAELAEAQKAFDETFKDLIAYDAKVKNERVVKKSTDYEDITDLFVYGFELGDEEMDFAIRRGVLEGLKNRNLYSNNNLETGNKLYEKYMKAFVVRALTVKDDNLIYNPMIAIKIGDYTRVTRSLWKEHEYFAHYMDVNHTKKVEDMDFISNKDRYVRKEVESADEKQEGVILEDVRKNTFTAFNKDADGKRPFKREEENIEVEDYVDPDAIIESDDESLNEKEWDEKVKKQEDELNAKLQREKEEAEKAEIERQKRQKEEFEYRMTHDGFGRKLSPEEEAFKRREYEINNTLEGEEYINALKKLEEDREKYRQKIKEEKEKTLFETLRKNQEKEEAKWNNPEELKKMKEEADGKVHEIQELKARFEKTHEKEMEKPDENPYIKSMYDKFVQDENKALAEVEKITNKLEELGYKEQEMLDPVNKIPMPPKEGPAPVPDINLKENNNQDKADYEINNHDEQNDLFNNLPDGAKENKINRFLESHPEPFEKDQIYAAISNMIGVADLFGEFENSIVELCGKTSMVINDILQNGTNQKSAVKLGSSDKNDIYISNPDDKKKLAELLLDAEEIVNELKEQYPDAASPKGKVVDCLSNTVKLAMSNDYMKVYKADYMITDVYRQTFLTFPTDEFSIGFYDEHGEPVFEHNEAKFNNMLNRIPFVDQLKHRQEYMLNTYLPYMKKKEEGKVTPKDTEEFKISYRLFLDKQREYFNKINALKSNDRDLKDNRTVIKNTSFNENWGKRFNDIVLKDIERTDRFLERGWSIEDIAVLRQIEICKKHLERIIAGDRPAEMTDAQINTAQDILGQAQRSYENLMNTQITDTTKRTELLEGITPFVNQYTAWHNDAFKSMKVSVIKQEHPVKTLLQEAKERDTIAAEIGSPVVKGEQTIGNLTPAQRVERARMAYDNAPTLKAKMEFLIDYFQYRKAAQKLNKWNNAEENLHDELREEFIQTYVVNGGNNIREQVYRTLGSLQMQCDIDVKEERDRILSNNSRLETEGAIGKKKAYYLARNGSYAGDKLEAISDLTLELKNKLAADQDSYQIWTHNGKSLYLNSLNLQNEQKVEILSVSNDNAEDILTFDIEQWVHDEATRYIASKEDIISLKVRSDVYKKYFKDYEKEKQLEQTVAAAKNQPLETAYPEFFVPNVEEGGYNSVHLSDERIKELNRAFGVDFIDQTMQSVQAHNKLMRVDEFSDVYVKAIGSKRVPTLNNIYTIWVMGTHPEIDINEFTRVEEYPELVNEFIDFCRENPINPPEDEASYEASIEKWANALSKGTDRFKELKMPAIDYSNPEDIKKNMQFNYKIRGLVVDFSQEKDHIFNFALGKVGKKIASEKLGKDKYNDMLGFWGNLQNLYAPFYIGYADLESIEMVKNSNSMIDKLFTMAAGRALVNLAMKEAPGRNLKNFIHFSGDKCYYYQRFAYGLTKDMSDNGVLAEKFAGISDISRKEVLEYLSGKNKDKFEKKIQKIAEAFIPYYKKEAILDENAKACMAFIDNIEFGDVSRPLINLPDDAKAVTDFLASKEKINGITHHNNGIYHAEWVDVMMRKLFSENFSEVLLNAGLKRSDMFIIDGKSAASLWGAKYIHLSEEAREECYQVELLKKIAAGNSQIKIKNIAFAPNGGLEIMGAMTIYEPVEKMQELKANYQVYKKGAANLKAYLVNIQNGLLSAHFNKDPNTVRDEIGQEGSKYFRNMETALDNAINALDNNNLTMDQIEDRLRKYYEASAEYYSERKSLFNKRNQEGQTRLDLSQKAKDEMPDLIATYHELANKVKCDLMVTSEERFDNAKIFQYNSAFNNKYVAPKRKDLYKVDVINLTDDEIADRMDEVNKIAKAKREFTETMKKCVANLGKDYTKLLKIESQAKPEVYDMAVAHLLKNIVKEMESAGTDVDIHEFKENAQSRFESGAFKKEAEKLSKNPVFIATVKQYKKNFHREWNKIEKNTDDAVRNMLNSINELSDAEVDVSRYILTGKKDGYAQIPKDEQARKQQYARLGDFVSKQILTDPVNRVIVQAIVSDRMDISEVNGKIVEGLKKKHVLDGNNINFGLIRDKINSGEYKRSMTEAVVKQAGKNAAERLPKSMRIKSANDVKSPTIHE